jgi:hypothetical protein
MGHQLLDEHTADRLLSGVLDPEDAPPGYAGVATLLQAAAMPPTPQEVARCARTVAAMAGAVAASATAPSIQTTRRAGLTRLLRPRIAATLMAGALVLFSGLAAAGALPGPLQHAAHVAFGAIGISVPDSDSGSDSTGASPTSIGPSRPTSSEHRGDSGKPNGSSSGGGESHHGKQGGGSDPNGTPPGPATHHASNSGTHHHPKGGDGSTAPTGGSDPQGPKGLCNSWKQGKGGEKGKKLSAAAFRRLKAMAEADGQTIAEFCGSGDGSAEAQGDGEAANGSGKHHGHHKKHSGDNENAASDKSGGEDESGEDPDSKSEQSEDSQDAGHQGGHGHGGNDGDEASASTITARFFERSPVSLTAPGDETS